MKKNILQAASSIAFIVLLSQQINAQNYEDDALTYSQTGLTGSARIQAIGGAQVALGGDIGSFGINPAGIAFYRSSDIGITFQYDYQSSKSTYLGNGYNAVNNKIIVPNFGVVFSSSAKKNDGSFSNGQWNNFTFGVSHNRINNLNGKYIYSGYNANSSITSYFADLAYSQGLSDGEAISLQDVAYDAGLIDTFTTAQNQLSYWGLSEFGEVQQYREVLTEGRVSETNFTLGGNYGNRLYIGASVAYVNVHQEYSSVYSEYDINDPAYPFPIVSFDYLRKYTQTGSGINVKLGTIYRPVDDLRIGLSVQTPTFLNMQDENSDEIITLEADNNTYSGFASGIFEYKIRTPLKLNFGLAKFFSNKGFLAADVEYVDYSRINFNSRDYKTDQIINGQIAERYKSAVNVRVGGEYKLDDFNLRLGYAYFASPEKNASADFSKSYFTGGAGYRYGSMYVDLTGVYSMYKTVDVPYLASNGDGDISPVADIDRNRLGILLTVGTRF